MALLRKSLAPRMFGMLKINNRNLTNCRTSSPRTAVNQAAAAIKLAPGSGQKGVYSRFLHRQPASASPAGLGFVPTREKLLENLRGMDIAMDRIRLAEVRPPATPEELTVADARKILRLSQLEKVKSRLRQIDSDCISYPEFVEICVKECSNLDQGMKLANKLDESETVIVLGNVVYLKPEQVIKAIQGLLRLSSPSTNLQDPRMKDLQELEKQKAAIDGTAEASVKRELWAGLAYLAIQTAAFMRLTFWELTWDVMEPICFFVTSMYFMGAYLFFLRTAKEPSFEAFSRARFSAKQRSLFKVKGFDIERYTELKKACCSKSVES